LIWPEWDRTVFLAVNGAGSGILTAIMRLITNVDNWVPFLLAAVVLLILAGRTMPVRNPTGGRWKRALQRRNPRIVILCLILSAAASDQASYHLKRWVGRPRPCFDPDLSGMVEYRGDVHGNRSFPSAHAANSAALATAVSLAYPPMAPVAALVAFLVGYSRVYLGVHYPLDVIAGWGIGVACGSLVWLLLLRWVDRQGLIGFLRRFRWRQPDGYTVPPEGWERLEAASLDGHQFFAFLRRGGERLALVAHGLNEEAVDMLPLGDMLHGMGFSVLLVPLRGHPGHSLPVTTGGPAEVLDLAGALIHAEYRLGFERSLAVVFGSSMGAAAALKLSGLLQRELAGVVAQGAYMEFFSSARRRMGRLRTMLMKLILPKGVRDGLEDFRPVEYAARCTMTRFVYITGELDRISPPELAGEMAGMTGGRALILEGRGHPVWKRDTGSMPQIGAAIGLAMESVYGEGEGEFRVSVSGVVRKKREKLAEPTGREI